MNKKFFRKLKSQILIFISANVIIWFIISDLIMKRFDYLEQAGKLVMNNRLYNLFLLFQVVLFIVINIPFVVFMINHIDKPVQKILKSLSKIKEEDFSEKINFSSSNEFDEIKNSINIMAQQLEKSKKLREDVENQRIMLFANMAHDLKTPITIIQGFSKALSDDVVESEEKSKEYIKAIHNKSQNMNDLIDRMFEYVKLDSRDNILHFEQIDIAELLRNCVASSYSEFEDKNISLEIQIPESPVIKNVDRVEITRVFTNLLNNVLSHNSGNIRCLIKMNEEGTVVVADSGERISDVTQENLFQPFVKGDCSRKSGKGSGLGLSLSKKIMEKHKGKIDYLNEYPEYTKAFVVSF